MTAPLDAHLGKNPSAYGLNDVTAPTEGSTCDLHDSGNFGTHSSSC